MRNTKTYLPVESVRERDIDFLLIEEMVSSGDFVDFITKQLDLLACSRVVSVERSVNDFNLGETDILVEYLSGSKRVGILIENKLDATFQPRQFQRYKARARQYRGGGYDEVYCVLIASRLFTEKLPAKPSLLAKLLRTFVGRFARCLYEAGWNRAGGQRLD